MQLPDSQNGILGLMPAYIKPYEVMGVKVLSVFANNYLQGLSSHQGYCNCLKQKQEFYLAVWMLMKLLQLELLL